MIYHLRVGLFAFMLGSAPVAANGTVIGFDSVDASMGPVAVTNQFAGLGVTFSGLFVQQTAAPFFSSSPNTGVIIGISPFSLLITAVFSADVTNVFADFFDTEVGSNLVTMTAFDASNTLLGTTNVLTPGAMTATVGLSFAGIRKITMTTDADGTLFDDFTFLPSIAVSEPATLALFAFGLVGLGLIRRRRRILS